MRYINKIEIPFAEVPLNEYFSFYPSLGPDLPKDDLSSFMVGCQYSFRQGNDMCRFQLASQAAEKPGHSRFTLDLDYFTNNQAELSDLNPLDWVNSAHQKIDEIFEGCISDNLRKLFQEVK